MLAGIKYEELRDGLIDAFDVDELRLLLRRELNVQLDYIVPQGPLPFIAFALIEAAARAGWLQELIEAAYRARPRNRRLAELYNKLGLAPTVTYQEGGVESPPPTGFEAVESSGGFESVVATRAPSIDLDAWRGGASRVADQVCRIESGDGMMATGFLVGPDAVLTCDVVFDRLLKGLASPAEFKFRFEYKVLEDSTRSDGVVASLHQTDWLLDHSPRHPHDLMQLDVVPTPDELGYTLVRLNQPLGSRPRGGVEEGPPRGWVWMPDNPPPLHPKGPVVIAHYPRGEPLKITFDAEGLIGLNDNHTRVRYLTATDHGSAGAPCFDEHWTLFALHQGRFQPEATGAAGWRQGVLTAAIQNRLKAIGKAGALGGKQT